MAFIYSAFNASLFFLQIVFKIYCICCRFSFSPFFDVFLRIFRIFPRMLQQSSKCLIFTFIYIDLKFQSERGRPNKGKCRNGGIQFLIDSTQITVFRVLNIFYLFKQANKQTNDVSNNKYIFHLNRTKNRAFQKEKSVSSTFDTFDFGSKCVFFVPFSFSHWRCHSLPLTHFDLYLGRERTLFYVYATEFSKCKQSSKKKTQIHQHLL